ncbi:MAG: DUF4369 domain-containing protein [Prevotella sp.]|nr:DUF4369 domain-containing protein [Prevotella sp.]MDD7273744.1 DUF4369 domain-containing protein [Prevotellaceae bacterium]MDY3936069.1 DUF4369 domain-containing protein [Prevotella sp.]MDY4218033.1 DUF4369 domain-containing protein [Prevotella sp.]
MKKIFYTLFPLFAFASCATNYNIQGTSNVSSLDGQKLYLKTTQADTLVEIDSCDVIHGKFAFHGNLDSVKVVHIYMDNINLQFPIVLEEGDINVRLDDTQQSVSGTPLNDKLNEFWTQFTRIRNQYMELDHQESTAIMNGQDETVVNERLIKKALEVYAHGDKLFTNFVLDNFDNILSSWGFFTRVTYDTTPDAYPIWMNDYLYVNAISQLPAWVEYIMTKAPESFKNAPDIKRFYKNFQQAQSEMNGMASPQGTHPHAADAPMGNSSIAPPTPAQLAGDSVASQQ